MVNNGRMSSTGAAGRGGGGGGGRGEEQGTHPSTTKQKQQQQEEEEERWAVGAYVIMGGSVDLYVLERYDRLGVKCNHNHRALARSGLRFSRIKFIVHSNTQRLTTRCRCQKPVNSFLPAGMGPALPVAYGMVYSSNHTKAPPRLLSHLVAVKPGRVTDKQQRPPLPKNGVHVERKPKVGHDVLESLYRVFSARF